MQRFTRRGCPTARPSVLPISFLFLLSKPYLKLIVLCLCLPHTFLTYHNMNTHTHTHAQQNEMPRAQLPPCVSFPGWASLGSLLFFCLFFILDCIRIRFDLIRFVRSSSYFLPLSSPFPLHSVEKPRDVHLFTRSMHKKMSPWSPPHSIHPSPFN